MTTKLPPGVKRDRRRDVAARMIWERELQAQAVNVILAQEREWRQQVGIEYLLATLLRRPRQRCLS